MFHGLSCDTHMTIVYTYISLGVSLKIRNILIAASSKLLGIHRERKKISRRYVYNIPNLWPHLTSSSHLACGKCMDVPTGIVEGGGNIIL